VHNAAVGCSKLNAPAAGWLRHDASDDVTTVGCDTSSDQWQLRCHGNEWVTGSGDSAASINCTQGRTQRYSWGNSINFRIVIFRDLG